MIAYLILFCVAGVPALFHSARPNRMLWALAWVVFVLFIGLRHQVGGDWDGYLMITERISQGSLLDAIRDQEILFSLLTWCSTQLGLGVYGANLFGAVVFCTGLFAFCARLPNRWLALATATPFLVIVAVMSANRQGMAIGIVLLAMSRWQSLGLLQRSIGILVAGLFHTSAILLLVLSVADLRISRAKKFVLMLITCIAIIWLVSRSEGAWNRYTTIYVQQSHGAYSPGAIFHLLLNLVPAAVMLVFRKRWSRVVDTWPLIRQLCWMALGLLVLTPFFTVAVGRMSLYLFPISITFVAYLPQMMDAREGRALVRTFCVLLLGLVLWLWLAFANTAFTYLPYKSVLTIHPSELALPR